MARKRMVSRTVTTTSVTVICMDIVKHEPITKTLVITGAFTVENKKLKKLVSDELETDVVKVVTVTSAETSETKYGMLESEFVKLAKTMGAKETEECEVE